jgi:predicted nucleic acid-binding protein
VIILLDNTVLSNFALVGRADLLQQALDQTAATTVQVLQEFQRGVDLGLLPNTDWSWLRVLTLAPQEEALYQQLCERLNEGEASCLAIAAQQKDRVLTDDRDARWIATQMQIPISGTLGLLRYLVERENLSLSAADQLLREMIAFGYRSPIESISELL